MNKRILISIIGLILIGIGYFGFEMFQFAQGVTEDTNKQRHYLADEKLIIISDSISPSGKYKYYEYQFDNGGLGRGRVFWSVTENNGLEKNLYLEKIPDGYKTKGWTINNELILEKWDPYYYKDKNVELNNGSEYNGIKIIIAE